MSRPLTDIELTAYADVLDEPLARKVRIRQTRLLPPGAAGMTLRRTVLLKNDHDRIGRSALLVHELIHVRQWADLGTLRFLGRYGREYVAGLVRTRSHNKAYREISLEHAAYDEAGDWATSRHRRR